MGTETTIAWTQHTFNPWIGCTKVSAGCANCYAKTMDDRHLQGAESHWGPGAPRIVTSPGNWKLPTGWANRARAEGKRRRVFCASLADVFDLEAPRLALRDLLNLIEDTSDCLDWQILTKRPERILVVLSSLARPMDFFLKTQAWLGTSTENQDAADSRIPELLAVPAAVHFVSAEPLLGPLDLGRWLWGDVIFCEKMSGPGSRTAALKVARAANTQYIGPLLDWVICGGESGPRARAMLPIWAIALKNQCSLVDVPFFMKQGSAANWNSYNDFQSFPTDLQVRKFPNGR